MKNLCAEMRAAKAIPESGRIVIPHGPRLGHLVIEASNLCKGYEDRILIENLDFRLPPGGIVGVIGPNGSGKTTLFRMIAGMEAPDEGVIRMGETVIIGMVDQSRDALDPSKRVWEAIAEGADMIDFF